MRGGDAAAWEPGGGCSRGGGPAPVLRHLTFGTGLVSLQAGPGESSQQVYAGGIDFAREAERLGFTGLWAAEHHLSHDGYLPSPLVYLAAAAGATDRIRLGSAIAIAPLYHGPRLAEDCATLQLLSRGRLILGLGLGWRQDERRLYGVEGHPRARELEGLVSTLRDHWEAGLVTPAPTPPVPVYVSGFVDPAARRAGRIGDGFIQVRGPRSKMARHISLMRSAAVEAGRDPDRLELVTLVSAHISEGDAWEEVRRAAMATAAAYVAMTTDDPAPGAVPTLDEEEVRRTYICGRPDAVTAALRELLEVCAEAPRHHLVIRNLWSGLPLEASYRSLDLFMSRVAPNLV